jgi:glycosyltransferase involved in cell wall biosynthesis
MKTRLAFVINSIGYGGAERALHTILTHIGRRADDYEIHLVLLDREPDARDMPSWVVRHGLDGRGGTVRSLVQLTQCIRRIRPALVVSFLVRANVCSIPAARMAGAKVAVCERMHLSSHLAGRYSGAKLAAARALPRLAYRHADAVLGVSTGVTEDLVRNFAVPARLTHTIFNAYDLDAIRAAGAEPPEFDLPGSFVVAVGRLIAAKNMAGLIAAYDRSGLAMPLVILGEGEERPALEALIAERGLLGRVLMPGYARNPFAIVSRARIYASASHNEGFPNAMLEAMALGVPVVATDCRSGPAEILAGVVRLDRPGVTEAEHGILVPEDDEPALAEALARMDAPAVHARYRVAARERSRDFVTERVCESYWRLFDHLAAPA